MTAVPTRPAAVSLLVRVLDQGQTLDEALAQDELFESLTGADRGLARAIVSATLRHLGQINYLVSQRVEGRGFASLDPYVQHLLQIGAAQICILKTPVHAAVSETVDAARKFEGSRRAGGLVNAVLRKLKPDTLEQEKMPAVWAWPHWFQALMKEQIGPELSEQLALRMQETPPLDITVRSDAADWAERLGGEALTRSTVRLSSGVVEQMPGYDDGDWWVQDAAASLPVQLLAPKAGERILDMCAAPGGKTMQIASAGAKTWALDRSAKRLKLVEQNLKRTKLAAQCIAADAAKWESIISFDGVLIDAPCSALGTLRRHPEGPWVKRAEDIERFPGIQLRLLESASGRIKPNGRLVYCVCTPLPREGVEVVQNFLAKKPDWQISPITPEEAGIFASGLTQRGDLVTFPPLLAERGGCDAFYIARLEKVRDQ